MDLINLTNWWKVIIAGLAALTGMGAGMYFSFLLKTREERLRELSEIVLEISLLIRYKAAPVKEMLSELSRFDFIKSVNEKKEADFRTSWLISAEELAELSPADIGIVKSIGYSLGNSDVQGQLSMLELNGLALKRSEDEAHEAYLKKGKTYRTLGLLGGILAGLLIL